MAYDLENAFAQQRRAANGGGLGAGAGELALAFMGGSPMHRQQVQAQGALIQDRLAMARQRQWDEAEKQHQRDARRGLVSSIAEKDPLGAQFLDSYENPDQAAKARHDLQESQFSQAAWEARNGDPNALNRMLMVMQGKPVEFQRSLGDGSYTPNAYDTTSTPQLSDIGRAFVGEKKALAGEHNAQAARATAAIGADKAANYEIVDTPLGKVRVNKMNPSDTQPVLLDGQPVQKSPGTPQRFTQHEAVAALGGDNGTPDPARYRAFEDLKAKNPGMSDTDAFAQFRNTYDDDPAAAASAGMGPPAASSGPLDKLGALFSAAKPQPQGRKIVRTGTANGKRVVQYDDGTIEEAP